MYRHVNETKDETLRLVCNLDEVSKGVHVMAKTSSVTKY